MLNVFLFPVLLHLSNLYLPLLVKHHLGPSGPAGLLYPLCQLLHFPGQVQPLAFCLAVGLSLCHFNSSPISSTLNWVSLMTLLTKACSLHGRLSLYKVAFLQLLTPLLQLLDPLPGQLHVHLYFPGLLLLLCALPALPLQAVLQLVQCLL